MALQISFDEVRAKGSLEIPVLVKVKSSFEVLKIVLQFGCEQDPRQPSIYWYRNICDGDQ